MHFSDEEARRIKRVACANTAAFNKKAYIQLEEFHREDIAVRGAMDKGARDGTQHNNACRFGTCITPIAIMEMKRACIFPLPLLAVY